LATAEMENNVAATVKNLTTECTFGLLGFWPPCMRPLRIKAYLYLSLASWRFAGKMRWLAVLALIPQREQGLIAVGWLGAVGL